MYVSYLNEELKIVKNTGCNGEQVYSEFYVLSYFLQLLQNALNRAASRKLKMCMNKIIFPTLLCDLATFTQE